MQCCADGHRRSRVVKPSPSRDKPVNQFETPAGDLDQAAVASEMPLTPEERARLLVKLDAEFDAAERSIDEEGTISAKELLKERTAYWTSLTRSSGKG
jgi:hypothetical protein